MTNEISLEQLLAYVGDNQKCMDLVIRKLLQPRPKAVSQEKSGTVHASKIKTQGK